MRDSVGTATAVDQKTIDPITLEVIRCGLIAVANQVDLNITRTAYTPYIYEYKDYAVGVLDADGHVICQCTGGIPLFIADILGVAVRDGLAVYGAAAMKLGDIFITSHAGTIGQHLNNVVMYTPVFSGGGLVAFMSVVVHWMDIGGRTIGSVSKWATDIFQEGIQFQTIRMHSGGEPVPEIYRIILGNTRFPDKLLGDIEAQVAGCLMGRDLIVRLVEKYGRDIYTKAVQSIWHHAENAARDAIRSIPSGDYFAAMDLDDDGISVGKRLPVRVKATVDDDRLTIDLTGLPAQVLSPINSGLHGGAHTCARIAFKYLFAPDEPVNEGMFRPLTVVIPEGTIMSASDTAAMGLYNMPVPSVIDCIVRAFAGALPERVAAGHFGSHSTVQFSGFNPRTNRLFQCNDSGHGGWGGMHNMDGSGPYRTMAHGDTRIIPLEVQEALYPLMIEEFRLRADSGGAGQYRGGLGVVKCYQVLAPMKLMTAFERTHCPPWGICDGEAGQPANVTIVRVNGTIENALKCELELQVGDQLIVQTGGGGGYGNPEMRNPKSIAEDVRLGYVSAETAITKYGAPPLWLDEP